MKFIFLLQNKKIIINYIKFIKVINYFLEIAFIFITVP